MENILEQIFNFHKISGGGQSPLAPLCRPHFEYFKSDKWPNALVQNGASYSRSNFPLNLYQGCNNKLQKEVSFALKEWILLQPTVRAAEVSNPELTQDHVLHARVL